MAPSLTAELADWATSVRWTELPAEVREATAYRLADSIGLMLAGSTAPAGRAIWDYARDLGGRPESTVLATGHKLPAELTALVHGTWAHVHDFDDTEPESVIHPTSAVAAAALAVGEAHAASPEDVLAATAVGIEVTCRLGQPAGRQFHHRGFHATGLTAPIAVALTVGRLTHREPAVLVDAMGLAGSMSSGLLAFLSDGSWAKRLHPGWAAHGGMTAAGLAAHGFRGPQAVLEDRYGTYAAFLHGDDVDPSSVTTGLGSGWYSIPPHFKRFPCAHVIQPFLDAVLPAQLRPDDIGELVLRLPAWQVPIVCEPWETKVRPATEYQARTSLPFAVVSAVVDGAVGIDTFDDSQRARPELGQLLARVRYESDPQLEGFEACVEVRRPDGTVTRLVPPAAEPPLAALVRTKLDQTAGPVIGRAGLEVFERALDTAGRDGAFDPVELVRQLAAINSGKDS